MPKLKNKKAFEILEILKTKQLSADELTEFINLKKVTIYKILFDLKRRNLIKIHSIKKTTLKKIPINIYCHAE